MSRKRDTGSIIFLHNGFENSRTWSPLIELLQDDFRCLAFDRRGYNPAGSLEAGHPMPDDLLADGIRELDEYVRMHINESEPWLLYGHCIGGAIALAWASEHPGSSRLPRAVLAEAPGLFSSPALAAKSLWLLDNWEYMSPDFREFFTSMHGGSRAALLYEKIREHRQSYIMNESYSILDRLEHIYIPVCIWQGDRDVYFTPAHAREGISRLARGRLVIEAGAGHDLHRDLPDKALELIRSL